MPHEDECSLIRVYSCFLSYFLISFAFFNPIEIKQLESKVNEFLMLSKSMCFLILYIMFFPHINAPSANHPWHKINTYGNKTLAAIERSHFQLHT